jgi:endo-1,4-beta-xylanase
MFLLCLLWFNCARHSWLDDFPVRGRKDYPLLLDKTLQPKKAFYQVISMAQ